MLMSNISFQLGEIYNIPEKNKGFSLRFGAEDIEVAKPLLLESVSSPHDNAKGFLLNIKDIISLFIETDPERVPIFIPKDLDFRP